IREDIISYLNENGTEFTDLSDRIWGYAETCFTEFQSAKDQINLFTAHGFRITTPVADMDTAFIAEYGEGKPVIAMLGEYDGLPNMSQKADATEFCPIEEGGNGHGCGHNILGAGMVAAACATKEMIDKYSLKGTVRYYGCPAEEGGGGKVFMVRAGAFDDVDCALSWHPGLDNIMMVDMFGCITGSFHFHSPDPRGPQASMDALDAAEIMNVGVQYLREHVTPGTRIETAYVDAGGIASNVPKTNVTVLWCVRAFENDYAKKIFDRVMDIARGAAMISNTTMTGPTITNAYAGLRLNKTLQELVYNVSCDYMPIEYTEEEYKYAKPFQAMGRNQDRELSIDQGMQPMRPWTNSACTDVGDVSMIAPTCGVHYVAGATGTRSHHFTTVAQGKSSIAHKGLLFCGKVMSTVACELYQNEELMNQITAEFNEMTKGKKFHTYLPDYVTPESVRINMYGE
ncbi:MAG: amidohydrolase, partial [Mogibacterium sp.]|nr:amidohydrolase [Mogibacterium sp.]